MENISDDLESWNPMEEDYKSPRSNIFLEGPGSEQPNGEGEDSQRFRIRVQNIPKSLTNQGLSNIFSKFGPVELCYRSNCRYSNNFSIAFLEFSSQLAASTAIKEVHKEQPFFLKVSYAKPQENSNQLVCEMARDSGVAELVNENIERNNKEAENIYACVNPSYVRDIVFPVINDTATVLNDNFDPMYSNPFMNCNCNENKVYPGLNKFYQKLFNHSDVKVMMGRGYVKNKVDLGLIQQPSRLRFGKLANNSFLTSIARVCEFCSKPGKFKCKICGIFYCSKDCQMKAWPQHKLLCSSGNEAVLSSTTWLKITSVEEDLFYAIKIEDMDKFLELNSKLQELCPKQANIRAVGGAKCAIFDEESETWARGVIMQVSSPNHLVYLYDYGTTKKFSSSSIKWLPPCVAAEKPYALKIKMKSPKDYRPVLGNVISVILSHVENTYYFAVLQDPKPNFAPSSIRLEDSSNARQSLTLPNLSSVDFTNVTIKAIFSNSTYLVSRKNPSNFVNVFMYVKLEEDETQTRNLYSLNENIRIRCINRVSASFFIVEVEQCRTNNSIISLSKSLFYHLSPNDICTFKLGYVQRNSSFTGLLINNVKNLRPRLITSCERLLFSTLQEEMKEPANNCNFTPKVGSMVAVFDKIKNFWARGIIWSKSKLARVVLIDYGRVVSTDIKNLKPLNSKFIDLPKLGVQCVVKSVHNVEYFQLFLKNALDIKFRVEEIISKKIAKCYMCTGDNSIICDVEVFEWDATAEEVGLEAVIIKSGSKVKLTQFYSASLMYVQPDSDVNFMISQKLIKHVFNAQPLTRVPRFGELIACKWSLDHQYYRAQILEPLNDDEYRIFFVDYGTQEITKIFNIFPLSDELKGYPCQAVKVQLKDIDKSIGNTNVIKYLNSIGVKQDNLKITLENDDYSRLELHHSEGESINLKLNSLLKTRDIGAREVIKLDDIELYELEIDSEVELTLLSKLDDKYLMLDAKSDLVQYIFTNFQDIINDYCNSSNTKGYYPHENEVCFVEHCDKTTGKSNWCRAAVLRNAHLGSSFVTFLDIGGTGDILHRHIRKMSPQFMILPSAVCYTKINVPQSVDQNILKKSLKSFVSYSCHIISTNEDFSYLINIKNLNKILSQE